VLGWQITFFSFPGSAWECPTGGSASGHHSLKLSDKSDRFPGIKRAIAASSETEFIGKIIGETQKKEF
jgi:hypothetical protein